MSTSEVSKTVPLVSQVGGHPGVLASEDGSLLIKPAHPTEVAFYQSVVVDPGFAPLRPFVPKFYGTLRLEGKVDEAAVAADNGGTIKVVEVATEVEKDEYMPCFRSASRARAYWGLAAVIQSLVLENLSHSFAKPNILDIKLGTVLYSDDASPEKQARMEKTARETTSFETGVRLTGFQVYDLATGQAVNTPKTYGKSIKPADLSEGIARFFPFGVSPDVPQELVADSDAKPATGSGLPPDILLPVLESMKEDIADIRAALAQVHMRMVGGSLLIMYEADLERTREGLKWLEEAEEEEEEEEDEEDEEDEDEEDEEDEEGKEKRVGRPYLVKLIDFAHTKIVPGIGPDEGVLKGLDTVLRLLDGRIEQTRAVLASKDVTPEESCQEL